jgi:hypothetical protein
MGQEERDVDVSRRDLGALLGALGSAVGFAALAGMASEGPRSDPYPKVTQNGTVGRGAQIILVQTVLGSGPVASPPGSSLTRNGDLSSNSPASLGCGTAVIAVAQGCVTAGDGGGGVFYWAASSTEPDNGGTIIQPMTQGSPAAGRWVRIFEPGWVCVKWFGARGDGSPSSAANDTNAIMNALRCFGGAPHPRSVHTPCTVYFPQGTYLTTGIDLAGYHGVRLVGAGVSIPNAHQGGSVLQATGTAPPYVVQMNGLNHVIRDLVLDGANVVTRAVLLLDNSTTQNVSVRDCVITRAKPDTAALGSPSTGTALVRIGDPNSNWDIVHIEFTNIWLAQDSLAGKCSTNATYPFPRAKACVEIYGHNAEMIRFNNCQMYYATDIVVFYNGASASLYGCELEFGYSSYVRVDGWATNILIDTCWSEGSPGCQGGIWFHQTNLSRSDYNYTLTLRNNVIGVTLSGTEDSIYYMPNQPLFMEGNYIAGNMRITGTGSTWGLQRVHAFANVFWQGTFVDGRTPGTAQLEQIGTRLLGGRQATSRQTSELTRTVVSLSSGGPISPLSGIYLISAPVTVTLPDATVVGMQGRSYTLKNISPGAVTIATPSPAQTIDGATSYSLSTTHKYISVVSDGSNWQIVANN